MFQIIVDSAANIPAELVKKYKIKVLSFINFVNGKEVTCFDPELSPEEERQKGHEYYDAVRQGADVKTGLISTAIFEDAFRSAMENNEDVLYFSLSKNISGNFNSARRRRSDARSGERQKNPSDRFTQCFFSTGNFSDLRK